MLGETEFTLDIRPTFVDELDKAATYIVRGNVMEVRWFRYSRSIQPLAENPEYDSSDPLQV